MKKVPSLAQLGAALLLAASPAAAQTVTGRVSTPGANAGIVPTLGAGLGAPMIGGSFGPAALSLTPALSAPNAALTPSLIPAIKPAALVPVVGAASASGRMKDVAAALEAVPNLDKASATQSRDAGASLELALTGEKAVLSAPSIDAPTFGYGEGAAPEFVAKVLEKAEIVKKIRAEVAKVIVGQKDMIDSIITAMIASEHVLLEGVPGVAKTQTVKAFSQAVEGAFNRIQGTPDKLPSDILGAEILQENPESGKRAIVLEKGPIFTNILLVDEINRMMPKVQSSLLEAMQEGNATIGRNTLPLPKPFMVLATQNPIEQEGVYRLPEAQQDRFMYKVIVPRPTKEENKEIMRRFSKKDEQPTASKVTNLDEMVAIRKVAEEILVDAAIIDYIAEIVEATNAPKKYGIDDHGAVESGASPRAAIFLLKAAKINALLEGRAWVGPSDVRAVADRVLRHRITLSYSANAVTTDMIIDSILSKVPVPRPVQRTPGSMRKPS